MSLLDNLLGGQRQSSSMSPMTMAVVGLLAYKALKGGGLNGLLGSGQQSRSPNDSSAAPATGSGGLLGGLSGILGKVGGGAALGNGLSELLQQFRDAGHSDKAESWVGTGPDKNIAPGDLERVLGPEKIAWLQEHTGMSRDGLLAGLSHELPLAVDRLTPNGEVPQQIEPSAITA